jgi:tetratricopeptide (TPR) repeat protein
MSIFSRLFTKPTKGIPHENREMALNRAEELFSEAQKLLYKNGDGCRALPLATEAAEIFTKLVFVENCRGMARQYGYACALRAQLLLVVGKIQEGMQEFETLVKNVRSLSKTGNIEMIQPLAEFLITNGNYQLQSGLLKEADKAFEEAIEILESLLNTGDISDSRKGGTIIIVGLPPARQIKGELARALQNQSQVRLLQGDISSSVSLIDKATTLFTGLANEPSPGDNFQEISKDMLSQCWIAKAKVLVQAKMKAEAARAYRTALTCLEGREDACATELRQFVNQALSQLKD